MSSTPKRFTRYDAEHHDPTTEYVLASDHDATVDHLHAAVDKAQTHALDMGTKALTAADQLLAQATESLRLQRLVDTLTRELEAARAQLAALSYPVYLHTNPLLTVESGGIRYVLEAMSDEDGEWFEVKNATPTEAMTLETFTVLPVCVPPTCRYTAVIDKARDALTQYRAARREDDEAGAAE